MNYLILTEGKEMEPDIISEVLKKYGFNIVIKDQMKEYDDIEVNVNELSNSKNNIVIVQAFKNRLSDLLKTYRKDNVDLDMLYGKNASYFAGIFLLFDVDHTSKEDLIEISNIHNDETDKGLLLLSSPCIEIMVEPKRSEIIRVSHLKEYKHYINQYVNDGLKYGSSAKQYIIDNFEELALAFLEKNVKEFNSYNIMEHPMLIVKKINELNERTEELVVYRYFTTVIYVVLAYICGFTKEIDNYQIVKDFLMKNI